MSGSGTRFFQQTDQTLRFHLPTEGERTQRVAVHHVPSAVSGTDVDWVVIESAIARVGDVDLAVLLERAGTSMFGGVIAADGVMLLLGHTMSLHRPDARRVRQAVPAGRGQCRRTGGEMLTGTDQFWTTSRRR